MTEDYHPEKIGLVWYDGFHVTAPGDDYWAAGCPAEMYLREDGETVTALKKALMQVAKALATISEYDWIYSNAAAWPELAAHLRSLEDE